MIRCGSSTLNWALALCFAATGFAQDTPTSDRPKGAPVDDEMAAMMAEMMKYGTPGEYHHHLNPMAGRWKLASKFRMAPEAPWDESGGEADIDWILGGRFLQMKIKSPPSGGFPMEFEGFGLLGYDNLAKRYVTVWTDNFSTGLISLSGPCDGAGKVITLSGEFPNPAKHGAMTKARWVYKIMDENKFALEIWEPDAAGTEFLHGEITYSRVK